MSYPDETERTSLVSAVSTVFETESYLKALSLLLSFPLGLAYFVGLTVGLSLGLSLLIIWVGIPILTTVVATSWVVATCERTLANRLLGTDIRQPEPLPTEGQLRDRVKTLFRARSTWMGTAFLFTKFWMGTAGLILVVTGLSLSGALLTAPLQYPYGSIQVGSWMVNTLPEALLVSPVGAVVGIVALYAITVTADAFGLVATALLDTPEAFEGITAEELD